jgi:type II secretory pathway component PulF
MNLDEVAFLNRQLASMLKHGLPLEGALRELAREVAAGAFRSELECLARELESGEGLEAALARRTLPAAYRTLIVAGARSGNLPGVLLLAADHFERSHSLQMRLRSAVLYPALVLVLMLICAVSLLALKEQTASAMADLIGASHRFQFGTVHLVLGFYFCVPLLYLAAVSTPPLRRLAIWWVPGFRDASISSLSYTVELLLRSGVPLPEALDLVGTLVGNTPASETVGLWRRRVAEGVQSPKDLFSGSDGSPFPALFPWLVTCGGQDLAAGFSLAARFFRERADHRLELIVNAITPVLLVILAFMSLSVFSPIFNSVLRISESLGSD